MDTINYLFTVNQIIEKIELNIFSLINIVIKYYLLFVIKYFQLIDEYSRLMEQEIFIQIQELISPRNEYNFSLLGNYYDKQEIKENQFSNFLNI